MTDPIKAPEDNAELAAVLKAQTVMQEQLDAVVKANKEQADELEVFKTLEAVRVEKKYKEKAESYSTVGIVEDDFEVVKALSGLEGCEKIFKALDQAVAIVKADSEGKLDEVGLGGEANVSLGNDMSKIQAVAKSLREKDSSLSVAQSVVKAAELNPELV